MYLTIAGIIQRLIKAIATLFLPVRQFPDNANEYSIIIVGAGMSGITMGVYLQKRGFTNFKILERYDQPGGTWYENRYPSCGCDVPSHLYSFSFNMKPDWTRAFSLSTEIWQYVVDTMKKFNLLEKTTFKTTIVKAEWQESKQSWTLLDDNGKSHVADIVINCAGALNVPKIPNFKNKDLFKGPNFHSMHWRDDVDLTGKRVGVVGTGATSVQLVPPVAEKASQLYVFQRSPTWVPRRFDFAFSPRMKSIFKRFSWTQTVYRYFIFIRNELAFYGWVVQSRVSKWVRGYMVRDMKGQLKGCTELREKLIPDYQPGCKRVTPNDLYLAAFKRDNVNLVTDSIAEITETGIKTKTEDIDLDVIVWATGFDLLKAAKAYPIIGRNELDLTKHWKDTAEMYLGITHHSIPNAFRLLGPGTGLAHNSIIYMIECQATYTCECLHQLFAKKCKSMDLKDNVIAGYNDMVDRHMVGKAFVGGCTSWYRNERGIPWPLWPRDLTAYWWYTLVCQTDDYDFLK